LNQWRSPGRNGTCGGTIISANHTKSSEIPILPRHLIERDFPDGVTIPPDETGATPCRTVADNNAEDGVTWPHSHVTPDRQRTRRICDRPTPVAVCRAAVRNKLPILGIAEVRVLDPYFYK
jgi:hypothetical protein